MEFRAALTADPRSVGRARRFVQQALAAGGLGDVEDMAVLLVSELVTNVVRHTGGSDCELVVQVSDGTLHVEVVDASAALPRPVDPGPEDTGGRGLLLVDAVASQWGARPGPPPGKTVWFDLPAPG